MEHPYARREMPQFPCCARLRRVWDGNGRGSVVRCPVDAEVAPPSVEVAEVRLPVRRAVVEEDDVEVVVVLGEYAVDALRRVALHVVDERHHGYERALRERVRVWLWLLHVRVSIPRLCVAPAAQSSDPQSGS